MADEKWSVVTFEDAPLNIIDGDRGAKYPKQADFHTRGHCLFLSAKNVTPSGFNFTDCSFITDQKDVEMRKGKLQLQDVVLTTRGTVGNVGYFDEQVPFDHIRINSGMLIFRVEASGLSSRFLYLFLRSQSFLSQVKELMTGSAQPQLPIRDIKRIKIPLPPLLEQRAVTHILGTLDDKIELNRRMNETLEEIARTLFKSWFVDFDPVHAKADGRQPAGMNAETADLFPDSFEASESGLIPAGREATTLGDLCHKPQYGYTASASEEPIGPRFLRITDINKRAWVRWSDVPYCSISSADHNKFKLHAGDIVIARMADPGHGAVIEGDVDAVFASYLIRFVPKDRARVRYLQYWLRSDKYWEIVRGYQSGSTRANLNAQVLSSFPVLSPPARIADAFGLLVTSLRERVVAAVDESRALSQLQDSLLPKLVSGELRAPDAEKLLADAPV